LKPVFDTLPVAGKFSVRETAIVPEDNWKSVGRHVDEWRE
jgi:hypothetical protein